MIIYRSQDEGDFTRRMMDLHEETQRRAEEERYQKAKEEEYRKNHNSSSNSGSGATGSGSGFVKLVLFGIAGFILYKIYMFLKANWVSVVTILGVCVACAIICFVLYLKTKKASLKMLFPILAAAGLIGFVLFSGPRKTEAFFFNLRQMIHKPAQEAVQQEAINIPTAKYAYVTSVALNIRSGPFLDNKVVGQLSKDQRVEVVDNSSKWWKIKFNNIEGYVDSSFMIIEAESVESE